MFKLAIFDLDGTLLDTLTDLAVSCNYALDGFGFDEHEPERYKDFIGRGVTNLIKSALPEHSRDDATVAAVKFRFMEHYREHSQDLTRPYDGIPDMLCVVRSAGIKTAVVSNKPHENAVSMSAVYFPGLLDIVFGQRDGIPIKPNPTVVFRIMEHFGVTAEETIYIGDSGVDMQTGRAAGIFTVGVSWGFRPKDELRENGADIIIDKVSLLKKIIVDK